MILFAVWLLIDRLFVSVPRVDVRPARQRTAGVHRRYATITELDGITRRDVRRIPDRRRILSHRDTRVGGGVYERNAFFLYLFEEGIERAVGTEATVGGDEAIARDRAVGGNLSHGAVTQLDLVAVGDHRTRS